MAPPLATFLLPSFLSTHSSPLHINRNRRLHYLTLPKLSHICLATEDPSPPLASAAEIDMLPGRDGVFSARRPSVVILWDLDNKPPRGPPFQAASALKRTSSLLGEVGDFSAYANHHAFSHVPGWVRSERSDRRRLDLLEKKGLVTRDDPYRCGMCGRKFYTRPELKRHFKQLHERERTKKVNRMRSLKGKKQQKYRERFVDGNQKYENTARELLTPKSGYGLASELRRAGVHVKTVQSKPQAADIALKNRLRESLAKGIDWMVLVSDDSDFIETVRMAQEFELRTVVVGDGKRALGREADLWLPWVQVENGGVTEPMLKLAMEGGGYQEEFEEEEEIEGFFDGGLLFEDDDDDDFDEDEEEESDFGDDIANVFEEIIGGRPKGRRGGRGGSFDKILVGKPKGRRGRGGASVEEFTISMDFDEADLSMFGSLGLGDGSFWDSDSDDDYGSDEEFVL